MYQEELKTGINNFEYFSNIPTGLTINDYKEPSSKANIYSFSSENGIISSEKNEKNSILENSKTSSSYNCFSSF